MFGFDLFQFGICIITYPRMQKDRFKGQLSPKQLKQREISQQYLKIQQNTEVLTQIVRYNAKARKMPIKFNAAIDLKTFIYLIVQKSYLLYTCLLRKINLMLSLELYTRPLKKTEMMPMQQVYCEYLLEIDLYRYPQEEQENLTKKFKLIDINKSPQGYGEYLCKFIVNIKKKLAPHFERIKNSPDGYITRQMDTLSQLIESFLLPQIQKIPPKALILSLQQSQIFREYSLLVKCLNNSLFATIRFNSKNKDIYTELVELESMLLVQSKRDMQENAKRIETSIQQSVKLLLKYNVMFSEQSLNDSATKKEVQVNSQTKPYILGEVEGTNSQTMKYAIKVFVREKPLRKFTPKKLEKIMNQQMEDQDQKQQENKQTTQLQQQKQKMARGQYIIEFFSGKNLLCIKYITNIELNVQNTDVLMFHCNYLTYNWNNITLQFIQKSSGKSKRKQRYLAFKAISYVHFQQKVVFKILTMIDLLMIYAKISEPHLKKQIYNMQEYYQKTMELNSHCEHMKRVFIKKIEKNYQTLQESLLKL